MSVRFYPESEIRELLEELFKKLKDDKWYPASFSNTSYQCIAWSACSTDFKWWPPCGYDRIERLKFGVYWPENAPDSEQVEGFVEAFSLFGYSQCNSFSYELGFQKVAIFADDKNNVTHMARQRMLHRGWVSKLGLLEDIVHRDVHSVESQTYGTVVAVLKRPLHRAMRDIWNASKCAYRFRKEIKRSHRGWPRIEDENGEFL